MLTKKELDELTDYYKLKAYYIGVDDTWEPVGEVVFAKSVEAAKRKADIGDYTTEEINRVERQPHYDKYADLGYIPVSELYEDGWWFECHECYRKVSLSEEDEYLWEVKEWNKLSEEEKEGLEPPREYSAQFEGKDRVFCSVECQTKWHQSRDNLKKLKADTQTMLEAKYPDCLIKYAGGWYDKQTVSFDLTVPGLQYKVTYESDHPDTMLVYKSDMDAWETYRGRGKEAAA